MNEATSLYFTDIERGGSSTLSTEKFPYTPFLAEFLIRSYRVKYDTPGDLPVVNKSCGRLCVHHDHEYDDSELKSTLAHWHFEMKVFTVYCIITHRCFIEP